MTSFIDCLIKRIEKQQMTGPVRPLQKAVTVLMLHYLQEFLFLEQEESENHVCIKFLYLSLTHTYTHMHTHTQRSRN